VRRILVLIKGLGRGGAEQLLVNAAPHLDSSRFRYEVAYLLPWKDALAPELERFGIRAHCLDGARGPSWLRRLRGLVEERRIDLVHAHSPYAAAGARLALRGPAFPFVYTEHNMWDRYHRMTYWANAATFPRNDRVFAVSEEVRRSIRYPRSLSFLSMPPVETMYHGVDPAGLRRSSATDGLREEFGIPNGAPIIGTVANFKVHKGHRHLVRAADLVRRERPDARFVLVGSGPLEGAIQRMTRDLSLQETVVFAGFRSDVPQLIRSFDLFVLPSEHEGLPIALLEAMALGRPVVATRVGGTPEVVEDGATGALVPARDPRALADAVLALLADPARAKRRGRGARGRAKAFDIRKSVARTEQVYEELLNGVAGG
jgi:glycosyltransferase involved in cell wall biosynthesis